jgi:hypothetical protein
MTDDVLASEALIVQEDDERHRRWWRPKFLRPARSTWKAQHVGRAISNNASITDILAFPISRASKEEKK